MLFGRTFLVAIVAIFTIVSLITTILHFEERTNENMLVFAATPTSSFWDPESTATTLAKQAAASFLVVDTRMIWPGKNLKIMHPTIADQGTDFYKSKEQKDHEFKFKLKKNCLNGKDTCDKCLSAEVWTQ